jgi:NADPH:quinone reductase-like Zn-dependent oxidoreductase
MRCVAYNAFGVPHEVLRLAERPVPEPGPGEIRVRMTLSPIHNHDLWTIRGEYGVKPPLPAIGGTEAAGIVDKLGEGVTAPAVGQRVAAGSIVGAWPNISSLARRQSFRFPTQSTMTSPASSWRCRCRR